MNTYNKCMLASNPKVCIQDIAWQHREFPEALKQMSYSSEEQEVLHTRVHNYNFSRHFCMVNWETSIACLLLPWLFYLQM